MKKILVATFVVAGLLVSCNNQDDAPINENEKGSVQLHFDGTANGDKLLLNTSFYQSQEGEQLKITRFNFIVSNIRFVDNNGKEFVYPKDESYFIINSEQNKTTINLTNVPSGDYTKVIVGLGVDQAKYLTGEENQQAFWDYALENDMTWAWITGYKFINMEGVFTSATVADPLAFKLHIGSHGTSLDNYKELVFDLPNTARVRANQKPSIHFLVDAMKLVNGSNKIKLENHLNPAGTTASIMVSAEWSPKVMSNATEMFTVDHVHNNGDQH